MTIKDLEDTERKLKEKKEKKVAKISEYLGKMPLNYIIHIMIIIIIICSAILIWTTTMNARNDVRSKLIERVAFGEQFDKEENARIRLIIHEMVKPEALKQPIQPLKLPEK